MLIVNVEVFQSLMFVYYFFLDDCCSIVVESVLKFYYMSVPLAFHFNFIIIREKWEQSDMRIYFQLMNRKISSSHS